MEKKKKLNEIFSLEISYAQKSEIGSTCGFEISNRSSISAWL